MKVLQINSVYDYGSTGKITQAIHKELLKTGNESIVVYGRKDTSTDSYAVRVCSNLYGKINNLLSRITGNPYGGCNFSTRKVIQIIQKEKPDVVHLQCINGYFVNIYKLVEWLKNNKIPTVLTLHAEFMYTANCSHAFECEKFKTGCGNCPHLKQATKSIFLDRTQKNYEKMRKAFAGFENLSVISVSDWVMERAKQSKILMNQEHSVIYNGLDVDIFYPRKEKKGYIFHPTAYFSTDPNHPKGGYYVLELAKRHPEYTFMIAGKGVLEEKLDNVVFLGEIKNQNQLAEYYSAAQCTIITSKRETFSMVCAESLCCGSPVLGFKAGGPEKISLEDYSEFVEYGNLDALDQVLQAWMHQSVDPIELFNCAKKVYSKQNMIDLYKKEYQKRIWQKNQSYNPY